MRIVVLIISAAAFQMGYAQQPSGAAKTTFAARLIFQDHDARTLKWADVRIDPAGELSLSTVTSVPGFPKLDVDKQKLVQMQGVDGKLLVGVRDEAEGKFGSGYVLVNTNVRYTDHGDHGHWNAKSTPTVLSSIIDKHQGNPAHVYEYSNRFYVANDLKNGYTQFEPAKWHSSTTGEVKVDTPRFLPGGGNHITLAVVGNRVGYSCWIDGSGPNKGRVDVTALEGPSPSIRYSFQLPSGVIHGATTCANKVFFAPADGICWVEADTRLSKTSDQVQIKHISMGKEGDKPNRTGAFSTHEKHVLCVTGKAKLAKLVLINAQGVEPKPIFLPLHGEVGHKPLTPAIVRVEKKTALAFVFHDRDPESKIDDLLDVIALDPDGNRDYADARVVKTLKVGSSAVSGHYGHHSIAFDADGRFAYITNPGSGTIAVLDLKSLEFKATFKVSGKPTQLYVHGGRDHDD